MYCMTAWRPTPPLPVQLNWLHPTWKTGYQETWERKVEFFPTLEVYNSISSLSQAHSHITHHFRHTKQFQIETKRNVFFKDTLWVRTGETQDYLSTQVLLHHSCKVGKQRSWDEELRGQTGVVTEVKSSLPDCEMHSAYPQTAEHSPPWFLFHHLWQGPERTQQINKLSGKAHGTLNQSWFVTAETSWPHD